MAWVLADYLDRFWSRLYHVKMHLPKHLIEGRTSYSVPKQELKRTRCFTTLHVKRTVHESICDHSLERLQTDLARHLRKSGIIIPVSMENKASGNWVALAMPDAIPSRLGLITRVASLLALYSDVDSALAPQDATSSTFNEQFTRDLAEALPITLEPKQPAVRRHVTPAHRKTSNAISKDIIKPVLYDLISTDRSKGIEVLKSWRNHYRKTATAPPASETTTSVEECLHACTRTFPSKPWMVTLRFALGLHLEETELEAIEPAVEAAMQSVALTRDYWAWPQDSCSADNHKRLRNAVAISMVENQCSEVQAMVVVKNAAIAAESKFLERKLDLLETMGKEHSEVVMFLDTVEHFAAGNSLWCSSCPLYHRRH